MNYKKYFSNYKNPAQRQYDALRAFFYEKVSAEEVAKKFGYSKQSVYTFAKRFKKSLRQKPDYDPFFIPNKKGRPCKDKAGELLKIITNLRKQYLSSPDIKVLLDAKGFNVSERYITQIIKNEGFARLPRRSMQVKNETLANIKNKISASKSKKVNNDIEKFSSNNAGMLCLLPYLSKYGIDKIILNSKYPGTSIIDKTSAILSFLALKLSNIRRYASDDLWCMDRGLGLFAGLNVLPKTAWFSSYSSRVTRDMNVDFLKKLNNLWQEQGLLSDTVNLDFTTIPYWGDSSHLENNFSGKRNKALSSILAVIAQDPDSGIIDYGDTNIRHDDESSTVLEFLDFYRHGSDTKLKYLVFDSKFTNYANLDKLNKKNIKFVTIRKRGKKVVEKINNLPSDEWKKIRVMNANNKGRTLKVYEEKIKLKDYDGQVRQVAITGHGKIKPALIITNDFEISDKDLIRKYSRRWIVEKEISEQIEFFHLNRVSSSMVIKVDFDLTMTILAHNLYRLLALDLTGYSHLSDISIFEKFLNNSGEIKINKNETQVKLKKKRNLPLLMSSLEKFQNSNVRILADRKINFSVLSHC